MNKNSHSQLLKANAISWGGAVVTALILTYAAHGPAKHPHVILLICLLPVMMMSLRTVWSMVSSQLIVTAHVGLWVVSLGIGFVLGNTSWGDGIHPITTAATMFVAGAISLAILSGARTKAGADLAAQDAS